MGGIGLVFLTLPLVFGEMPMIGRLVSLLFFTMTAIAALTSVVSIVQVVTQFIIQCHRVYRTRAAILVTCVCTACAVPVAISLGSSLNGGSLLCLFGKNLLEILDGVTNTILMPLCAMAACLAMGWCSDRSLSGDESRRRQNALSVLMKLVAPLLIAVIEVFGIADLLSTPGGAWTLLCACAVLILSTAAYFVFYRGRDTGTNHDEAILLEQALERRKAGPQRGWYPERDR